MSADEMDAALKKTFEALQQLKGLELMAKCPRAPKSRMNWHNSGATQRSPSIAPTSSIGGWKEVQATDGENPCKVRPDPAGISEEVGILPQTASVSEGIDCQAAKDRKRARPRGKAAEGPEGQGCSGSPGSGPEKSRPEEEKSRSAFCVMAVRLNQTDLKGSSPPWELSFFA